MTIEEFVEKYSGSPFSLSEVADVIIEEAVETGSGIGNSSDVELLRLAYEYSTFKDAFETALEEVGFEFG